MEEVPEIKYGLLYWKGVLWIPEDRNLKRTILESERDTRIAGHFGQDKTIKLVRQNFWWPKMDQCIIDYIRSCPKLGVGLVTFWWPNSLSASA